MKKTLFLVILLCCAVMLPACGSASAPDSPASSRPAAETDERQLAAPAAGDCVVTLTTSLGDISFVLFPEYAPMAVENFTRLAESGFYNGLPFHRVMPGFLIQTGAGADGDVTAWGGDAFPIELADMLHHYSGAVAMAFREGDGNRSQFYIVQTPADSVGDRDAEALADAGMREGAVSSYRAVGGAPALDGTDTVFGQVYAGMEVVDAIAAQDDGEPVTVLSASVSVYAG
ncbi:MAG: peptidylprolyl isomerase [Butyricicoccus sp.]|nr:peptidylprolyl isomerase [Butyricicoccus sp.]